MPDEIKVLRHADRLVVEIDRSWFGMEPVNPRTYRQATQWHEVRVSGPVANCTGRNGNSFPGMYYYHPTRKMQWVVMADGPVDWRECRLDVVPGQGVLELGLFSTGTVGSEVELKVWSSGSDVVPSQWRALETLVTQSFQLSPLPTRSGSGPDWMDQAGRCLAALTSERTMHPLARQLGGIAYHSMLDEHRAMYAQPKAYIELICQAGISRALHQAAQRLRLPGAIGISQRLAEHVIPRFFNPAMGIFENTYAGAGDRSGHGDAVVETWYALTSLGDILYLCAAFPENNNLREQATRAVETWLTIGRDVRHIFPLFIDVTTRENRGGRLNIAVSGLYADVMLTAAEMLPHRADEFRVEAAEALTVLGRFPVQQMFHQPELLARAAESAFRLGGPFRQIGADMVHAMLLMQYRNAVNGGLFEGCAGMMYPTFRESVAALVALVSLGDQLPHLPVRKIGELGMARCFRFLKNYGTDAVLPAEGLATTEMPDGANVGTAVYAAGAVFDLAYLQRLLG
ncbi:hypothetical protein [Jidongwangia harbinensis]|uniref:hypothetical protein n=1 Tax=Jidongwangia harbinensis TaxID=2878561 RepID=UPI001CD96A81|nr:hypothetical protein [Jidongwangia harbinensis]MCA2215456.1 hypothetical protein [Jidongwangia harbinensis]